MSEMTDERAAEVLAAHNEWRRFNGDPFGPAAPEMGDPAEIGRAIDHAIAALSAPQPPAEAQAQGGGEAAAWKALGAVESELGPLVGIVHDPDNPIHRALEAAMAALNQRDTAPPSAPVGVEGLVVKWKKESESLDIHPAGLAARRVCAIELEQALAQQPAAVDGESAEALKFLLSRIGSWANARWDQHLRHEFGDERAEPMIRALAAAAKKEAGNG